jgi:hypothetical protein
VRATWGRLAFLRCLRFLGQSQPSWRERPTWGEEAFWPGSSWRGPSSAAPPARLPRSYYPAAASRCLGGPATDPRSPAAVHDSVRSTSFLLRLFNLGLVLLGLREAALSSVWKEGLMQRIDLQPKLARKQSKLLTKPSKLSRHSANLHTLRGADYMFLRPAGLSEKLFEELISLSMIKS